MSLKSRMQLNRATLQAGVALTGETSCRSNPAAICHGIARAQQLSPKGGGTAHRVRSPTVGRHPKPSMVTSSVLHENPRAIITQVTALFQHVQRKQSPSSTPSPPRSLPASVHATNSCTPADQPTVWKSKPALAWLLVLFVQIHTFTNVSDVSAMMTFNVVMLARA